MISKRNFAACLPPVRGRKKVILRNLIIMIVILSTINLIYYTTIHINGISHLKNSLHQPGAQFENYTDDVEELIDPYYFVKTSGLLLTKRYPSYLFIIIH